MKTERIKSIDILKCFAIFLVLWGHAIMHFENGFQASYVFNVIYSFHMPLFMMLSGYFAVSSMNLKAADFFGKKFRQLLLPCISWGILCWLLISSGVVFGSFHLELSGLFHGWLGVIDNFWFLKSCFICYTLAWTCWQFGKYRKYALIVVTLICFTQGRFNINIMFPSFLCGMYLRRNERFQTVLIKYWYVSLALFMLLLPYRLISQGEGYYSLQEAIKSGREMVVSFFFLQILYRIALGLSGALTCYAVFRRLFDKAKLSRIAMTMADVGGGNYWSIHNTGNCSGSFIAPLVPI